MPAGADDAGASAAGAASVRHCCTWASRLVAVASAEALQSPGRGRLASPAAAADPVLPAAGPVMTTPSSCTQPSKHTDWQASGGCVLVLLLRMKKTNLMLFWRLLATKKSTLLKTVDLTMIELCGI
jgi:hypothetical protein